MRSISNKWTNESWTTRESRNSKDAKQHCIIVDFGWKTNSEDKETKHKALWMLHLFKAVFSIAKYFCSASSINWVIVHLLWELIFKNWGLCRVRYKEYWSMLKLNLKLEKTKRVTSWSNAPRIWGLSHIAVVEINVAEAKADQFNQNGQNSDLIIRWTCDESH